MSVKGQTKFNVQAPEKNIEKCAGKTQRKMSVKGQTKFTVQTPEKILRNAREKHIEKCL
jgi:hypothetical protein